MKVLYVTTISTTVNAFLIPHIKMLIENGNAVDVAYHAIQPAKPELKELGCKEYNISFSRNPFSTDNIVAYHELKKMIETNGYDIVHCHTPNASAITRLACKGLRKCGLKVFYTAHGFHFYKGAPLKNWLFYYPVEWLCSFWTDTLITINAEDYQTAKKHLHAKRTEYVPGVGIDLERFKKTGIDSASKRREIGVPEDCALLLSVGELIGRKNHKAIIQAIAGMDVYYAIAGQGEQRETLEKCAKENHIFDRVIFLGFRTDVSELYEAADVFVFPSFQEGLPVALMEAMAKGMPIACSRIRGNVDLIDESGGVLFDPADVQACRKAIENVLALDKGKVFQNNTNQVKKYSTDKVLRQLKDLYQNRCNSGSEQS